MKLCGRGHTGPRYKDGKCIPCCRAYYAANKPRYHAQATAWAKANRKRMSELTRNWQKRNEARDRARKAAYRKREGVKERERAQSKAWNRAHPERCVANVARRDALKRLAPGFGVTPEQWEDVLAASLGLCAYCNERRKLEMDHIDPISKGGAHDVANIVAACGPCNRSKRASHLLLWLAA
jgi:5-methylcytosine-specific restriction endonuclease McrA